MSHRRRTGIPGYLKWIATLFIILMVPFMITLVLSNKREVKSEFSRRSNIEIRVKENDINKTVDLEEYIIGVVASQVMADTPIEAIKAQAVIARTYAVKRLNGRKKFDASNMGQVYLQEMEMKQKWGSIQYYEYYSKIKHAVVSTEGMVLQHNNKYIDAVYHSMNSGRTRNAKQVWGKEIPYLVEIDSEYDMSASDYMKTQYILKATCIEKLKSFNSKLSITEEKLADSIKILKKDTSGYVTNIKIGNITMTGEEIRKVLEIPSACFTIDNDGESLCFTTKGQGHGVGLSQYGAAIMAKNHTKYDEILKYYYHGVKLVNILKKEQK